VRLLSVQHPKSDEPGIFGPAARAAGHVYDEWCPGSGAEPPGDPAEYDAILVMGGEQNVVDAPRLPYLRDEIALIAAALERDQPVLGVCLGAQLLVAAAGGEVVRVREPEIGWHEVEALPGAADDLLFGALPERFEPYCWHSYGVELPEGAELLLRSDVCTHGFRIGERAWGVQFHPEVTRPILLRWFASYRDDPDAVEMGFDPAAAEAELDGRLAPSAALGRALLGAFTAAAAVTARP
jgi:GMP synthase-like glutamine amidotransferase